LRPTEHFEPKFLWYQIQASRFQDELTLRAKTSAQPGIYMGDVTAIPVVVPLLEDQRQIVAYLDEQTARIDTLITETERFIELARERRSALITAAVTGQIDVREMV
jgi:type I restriction enzyme, S subunit